MDYRPLGESGLDVSAIAYGAMSITQDPEISGGVAPSLLAALDAGITLIDTARAYPGSEALVASTLREWRGARPLISTKLAPGEFDCFRVYRPVANTYPTHGMRASVEQSLTALGVETLDIVHLHQWHYLWTHEPEWLETLQALRCEGKVRLIAVSAQDHEHDALLELVSTRRVDVVQTIVNLFESRPANALLPIAKARGVGVIARCAFDSGGLSGALSEADFAARRFLRSAPHALYQARLDALRAAFVPAETADVADLALRFVLSLPGVSTATIGMPNTEFVKSAAASVDRGALPAHIVEAIRTQHVWTKNFYERLA
jgi:aryl-alcohol dehydrogenase-like predicted oxidoreductase